MINGELIAAGSVMRSASGKVASPCIKPAPFATLVARRFTPGALRRGIARPGVGLQRIGLHCRVTGWYNGFAAVSQVSGIIALYAGSGSP